MDTNTSFQPPPKEIVLADIVSPLWRGRVFLVTFALLGGIAALVYSLVSTPVYEASTTLLLGRSKIGAEVGDREPISIATFRTVIENQALSAQVLGELSLDKPPYNLTVAKFRRSGLQVDTVRDGYVLIVKVRLPDRQLAARAADRVAELSVQLADRLNQQEALKGRDTVGAQLEETRRAFELAAARLEAFKKQAQLEVLRGDTQDLLAQRHALSLLLVQIEFERASVAQAERELSTQGRVRETATAVDSATTLNQRAKETAPGTLPLRAGVIDPFVNPVHEVLSQEIALGRTRLSGLEHQRDDYLKRLAVGGGRLPKLDQLYALETQLSRLETEVDLAKRNFVATTTRYQETALLVAGRSAQFQTIDPAYPPDRPVSPRPVPNVLAGAACGLTIGVAVVLLRQRLRASSRA